MTLNAMGSFLMIAMSPGPARTFRRNWHHRKACAWGGCDQYLPEPDTIGIHVSVCCHSVSVIAQAEKTGPSIRQDAQQWNALLIEEGNDTHSCICLRVEDSLNSFEHKTTNDYSAQFLIEMRLKARRFTLEGSETQHATSRHV